ncbi:hypothetical protein ANCDUO_18424 [Ancylostoma duodenale]|uniref:Uncharacterized protein n=1 Tax=Ancylostoma duodenale TaxID=51022 RepID=A0A0C2G356_9BILA|nr:hypothetical protein ANCDUO_18424 [Ancylostoma duodenale]
MQLFQEATSLSATEAHSHLEETGKPTSNSGNYIESSFVAERRCAVKCSAKRSTKVGILVGLMTGSATRHGSISSTNALNE